jgi:hypothetical protein
MKHLFFFKFNASTIGYGILFFIVSSLLIFTYILYVEIERAIDVNSSIKTNLVFDNYFGLTLGSKFEKDSTILHIHSNGDTSLIKTYNWGLYKVVNNLSYNKLQKIERSAFYGLNKIDLSNLFIADNYKTIKYYGNIELNGTISIPNGTLEQSYFGQIENSINNSNFFKLTKSQSTLPEIKKVRTIENYFGCNKIKNNFKDSLFSFSKPTTLIDYESFGYVNNEIKGNAILYSKDSIIISKNAKLEHVLIYAPIIRIESEFTGTIQAFATDKIICEKNVSLNYPSVLAITKNHNKNGEITIGKNCKVFGGILLTAYQSNTNLTLTIEDSKIGGIIYNEGKSNLSGQFYGSIISFEMFKVVNGSIFTNYISGFQLNDKIPEGFCFPILFKNNKLNFLSCIL